MAGSWADGAAAAASTLPMLVSMSGAGVAAMPAAPSPSIEAKRTWLGQMVRAAIDECDSARYSTSFKIDSTEYVLRGRVPFDVWQAPECQGSHQAYAHSASKFVLSAGPDFTPASLSFAREKTAAATVSAMDTLSQMVDDAAEFAAAIKFMPWQPSVWSDDGEIVFEWIEGHRHAVVSIEGDGRLGYTMRIGDQFVSGAVVDASVNKIPEDLLEYLA